MNRPSTLVVVAVVVGVLAACAGAVVGTAWLIETAWRTWP